MIQRLQGLFGYPLLLIRHRELLGAFVFRELRARFEGSYLGRIWPILNPIILVSIYYLVFVKILRIRLIGSEREIGIAEGPAMGLYLVTGILPWLWFSESILRSTTSVVEHASLIKKVAFPSELLTTYTVIVNLVYFLLALPVYFVLFYLATDAFPDRALLLPLPIFLQFVFSVGLGLFLAAFNVFVRDTSQFTGLGLMLWMFLTPIFYTQVAAEKVFKDDNMEWAVKMFEYNPMAHLMTLYRHTLLFVDQPYPTDSLIKFTLIAFGTLAVGLLFYQATKGRFADEV